MTKDTQQNNPAPEGGTTQSQVRPSIDQYERIVDRAHTEIEGVRTVYQWLLGTVGIAITIIFAVGIFFTYHFVKDFKADIKEDGEKLKAQLIEESKTLSSRLQKDLQDSLNKDVEKIRSELTRKVGDRIEKEFKSQNISALIRDNATSRVQEISNPLIVKEIETKIAPRIKTAENRIATLDDEISKARGTMDDLRAHLEFAMTVISAQIDDRQAFDKLKTWSEDLKYSFKNEAQQAWIKILDDHATPFALSGFTIEWADGIEPSKLSFEQLKAEFKVVPAPTRRALVEYIWKKRQDILKKDKMEFLIDVMKFDKSLNVVEYAGRFFTEESKQKIKPLLIDYQVDWWVKNKANYEKGQQKEPPDKK